MLAAKLNDLEFMLGDLVAAMDHLIASMKSEREAIIDYDLERITAACKEKEAVLLKIQLLETTRQTITEELAKLLGFKGRPTIELMLSRVKDGFLADQIRQKISCVKSLAQAAGEFNKLQRQIIEHSISDVKNKISLLDKLQGKVHNVCYTSQGTVGSHRVQGEASTVMDRSI